MAQIRRKYEKSEYIYCFQQHYYIIEFRTPETNRIKHKSWISIQSKILWIIINNFSISCTNKFLFPSFSFYFYFRSIIINVFLLFSSTICSLWLLSLNLFNLKSFKCNYSKPASSLNSFKLLIGKFSWPKFYCLHLLINSSLPLRYFARLSYPITFSNNLSGRQTPDEHSSKIYSIFE